MGSPNSNASRFREAREQAGLTVFDVAERTGLSDASVFDLESFDDELTMVYGPSDLVRIGAVLGVSPLNLLGLVPQSGVIAPAELAAAVHRYCVSSAITVADFEDRCGCRVAEAVQQPERLLSEFSIDGIRDVCRTANVEWEQFINGLGAAA
jgi:transcriptional regulator with XRE-family HTH domain